MKGYKGFDKGLMCRGKKYAEDTVFEESEAVIYETGMHFCKLPHQVFRYYEPGCGNEFAEVEALDEVHTDDGKKFVTTKLKIGKKISVAELCKRSVPEFLAAFEFDKKIEESEQSENYGVANVGDYGTANADDRGAANAGACGAANAGDCGVAIVRKDGEASVNKGGTAVAYDGWAKGEVGSVLVLIETDGITNIKHAKTLFVDGETVKPDTYYRLENGEVIEMEEEK